MEHAVLITGKQSSFTDDLIQEALRRSGRVFASYDESDTAPEVPDTFGDSLRYVPWRRRSLLSARTMMLSVEAEGDIPNRAIVVCAPEGINTSLHDTSAATVEDKVDVAVKGYLFVLREIASAYIRRGAGDLTILWYDPGMEILPPLDATISGAVQGLAQSMIAFYENEPVTLRGLYASDADGRAVAEWALDQIIDRSEKSAGRWQKYGQKMSLLPFRR